MTPLPEHLQDLPIEATPRDRYHLMTGEEGEAPTLVTNYAGLKEKGLDTRRFEEGARPVILALRNALTNLLISRGSRAIGPDQHPLAYAARENRCAVVEHSETLTEETVDGALTQLAATYENTSGRMETILMPFRFDDWEARPEQEAIEAAIAGFTRKRTNARKIGIQTRYKEVESKSMGVLIAETPTAAGDAGVRTSGWDHSPVDMPEEVTIA